MLSFWEKNSFLEYDYVIAGGGIAGLSVAASIKEKDKNASVLILEKGIFPTGASTKNAGFLCFGSLTEIIADINRYGAEETIKLVAKRWKGIDMLRKRLGDENIGFKNYGGYELILEENLKMLDKMEEVNESLKDFFPSEVFALKNEKIKDFGFNEEKVKALVYSPFESQMDTGKMMRSFISYVTSLGVMYLTGCKVENYFIDKGKACIWGRHDVSNRNVIFKADKLIICLNAFAFPLDRESDAVPGRGQIIVTEPIDDLRFKGVFHIDEGFYYFRNYGSRVIFGGGRNIDYQKEETIEFGFNEKILNDLSKKLRNIILPATEFQIADKWTGIMGFSRYKRPYVKSISENVYSVHICNGMGIALASIVAEELLQIINSD